MHRLILSLVVVLLASIPARACPMCAESVPQKSTSEQDDQQREAAAYNLSIYLMAGMPFVLLGCGGFWVYRGIRRADAALAAQRQPDEGGRPCSDPSPDDVS